MPQPLVGAVMHLQAAGSATQYARFAIVCKRHLALNAPCDRAHVVGVGGRVAAAGGHCVFSVFLRIIGIEFLFLIFDLRQVLCKAVLLGALRKI